MNNDSSIEKYRFQMENFPILCVDIVFFNKTLTKTLLFKRINRPQQGVYYTVGGHLPKNEDLKITIVRIVKEETGLDINPTQLIFGGVINEKHEDSIFEGVNYHGVTLYWGYVLDEDVEIQLNNQHSEYRWFSVDDLSIYHFVKERVSTLLEVYKNKQKTKI